MFLETIQSWAFWPTKFPLIGFKFKQSAGKKWKFRKGGQDTGSRSLDMYLWWACFGLSSCVCESQLYGYREVEKVTLLTLLLIMMLATANTDPPLQNCELKTSPLNWFLFTKQEKKIWLISNVVTPEPTSQWCLAYFSSY